MPIKLVFKKGKKGYQYGTSGKFYSGSSARDKARRQGRAIELSKLRREGRVVERKGKIIEVKSSIRAKGYRRKL